MNELRDFFNLERKRIIEPDPFFTKRVIARLNERSVHDFGIWDVVPGSTRPVLAVALVLLLCFIGIQMFLPQLPQRGMVESFLESEQNPSESFLYNEAELPTRQDVLAQLIAPEEE